MAASSEDGTSNAAAGPAVVGPTLAELVGIFPLVASPTPLPWQLPSTTLGSFIVVSWVIIGGYGTGFLHCKSSVF
jgi:hypothetical protein